jgi:parallel beta-helix repeat protein
MAFLDGEPLKQVGSAGEVGPGSFFVDRLTNALVIGSDPRGRLVEASNLRLAMSIRSPGTVVRGIGFRHYATPSPDLGAVQGYTSDLRFENNVFKDNAASGVALIGSNIRFVHNTADRNGQLGVRTNDSDGLLLEGNHVLRNNAELFHPWTAAGGVKIAASEGVRAKGNLVEDNHGHGLWVDVYSRDVIYDRNLARNNGQAGVFFELSVGAKIVNNTSVSNRVGIEVSESSDVQVWNNTMVSNVESFSFYTAGRVACPTGLVSRNNIVSHGPGSTWPAPLVVADISQKCRLGANLDHDAYWRQDHLGVVRWFADWANWPAGKFQPKTFTEFRQGSGQEAHGIGIDGGSTDPFVEQSAGGLYRLRSDSPARGKGAPAPADIAELLGVPAGVPLDMGALSSPA